MMKYSGSLFFALLFAAFPCVAAPIGNVRIHFSPSPAVAGEAVSVSITAELPPGSGGGFDMDGEVVLPPLSHARWQRGVSGMEISSGTGRRTMLTFRRRLIPEKEGKLSVPPVLVRFHGEEGKSAPAELTVLPAGTPPSGEEMTNRPLIRAKFSRRGPFYPGETAELEIELVSPDSLALTVDGFPSLTGASGIRLLALPDGEAANPAFRLSPPEEQRIKGKRFLHLRFSARALFLVTGEWSPVVTVPVSCRERDFFALPRQQLLETKLPAVSVLVRPPVPAGAIDTGLLGKWAFSCSLSPQECRTGEGAELTLTARPLSPHASAELFRAPVLSASHCRIYPPEIRREAEKITVHYALIPLQEGKQEILWRLAFFDPEKKSIQITEVPLNFTVKPGSVPLSLPAPALPAAVPAEKPANAKESGTADYSLKPLPGNLLLLPLLRNTVPASFLLAAGGVLLFLLSLFPFGRRENRAADRQNRRRRKILRIMQKKIAAGEEAAPLFQGENLAAVAESLGIASGSTAEEIAAKIPDPELQRFFAGLSRRAFSPAEENEPAISPSLRKKLRKFLSSLLIFLFLFCCPVLPAAEKGTSDPAFLPPHETMEKILLSDPEKGEISPEFCYDKGCLFLSQGEKEKALLWFTRARLLAPHDREVQSNRERSELALFPQGPEEEKHTSTLTSFRDMLRPDHYLLLAGATLFLLGALLFLRKFMPRPVRWWGAGTLLFLLMLWGAALASQARGPYSSRRLMLMKESVALRAMPSGHSGVLEKLSGGTEAELLRAVPGWFLIRAGEKTGWIPAEEAERVFPYGLF